MPPPDQRHNPKPYFQAAQRVVCVDASPSRLVPDLRPLVAGRIYVVRAIDVRSGWSWPRWGVLLEGVRLLYPGKDTLEWALHPRRFRPVVERPTDITMLKELLTTRCEG
jgi:hypothetical protein